MISEVVNSLFLTYLASEYLLAEEASPRSREGRRTRVRAVLARRTIPLALATLAANTVDSLSGLSAQIRGLFGGFLHLLRVALAATAYVCGLYCDVRYVRKLGALTFPAFLRTVGLSFLRVLPLYPLLAVVISFVFMFVIGAWEALHLPMEILNAPIYYGTLYGPFAWVYVSVKRQVCEHATSLPA